MIATEANPYNDDDDRKVEPSVTDPPTFYMYRN